MFWLVIVYHIGELVVARNNRHLIRSLVGVVECLSIGAAFEEALQALLLIVDGAHVQRRIA